MRHLAALLLLATPFSGAHAQDESAAQELVVIDLRPKEEKDGSALTGLKGKCNKDVYRIPDVASDPLKVDVFKSDLVRMLIDEGAGKTLTVLNWSIYYNKQVQGGGSALRGVGIGGYNFPTGKDERKPGSDCTREESAGGWYDAGELQSNYFPLVSEFEGTFAGKPVSVRVVHSPRRKIPGKFAGDEADTATLLEAVHATAEAVATEIAR
jgi:hypothetical protein